MTWENFILRLRARLQDRRMSTGQTITAVTGSGVRWSADELMEIGNTAITETIRMINLYSSPDSFMLQLASNALVGYSTGLTATDGKYELAGSRLAVLSVKDSTGNEYGYIPPNKFTLYLTSTEFPRAGERFFTVLYDMSDNKRKIFLLPLSTATIDITFIYNKADYVAGDAANAIFLANLDDLLLDIAEREARDREHNWDRSAMLDKRIAIKLGVKGG